MDFYTVISSFFAGILGAMGFGGGSVLIIYLTNFLNMGQKTAQGINLVFFIPIALLSVISYRKGKLINFKTVLPVIITGILGGAIGYMILGHIPGETAAKLFGGFLVVFGLKELLWRGRGGS